MKLRSIIAGALAGAVNGLFGAGGGMILVPLLSKCDSFSDKEVFSSSIVIILPICLISLLSSSGTNLPWQAAWPYLLGGAVGGALAAFLSKRIHPVLLHRILGLFILYGGIRYLC